TRDLRAARGRLWDRRNSPGRSAHRDSLHRQQQWRTRSGPSWQSRKRSVRKKPASDCPQASNPALPANVAYSEAHFNEVMKNPELAPLASYPILFIDSVTAANRLCFTWAEQQPEAFTDRGRKDLRATDGLHARSLIGWLNQLQHARGRTVVFVAVLEKNTDELNVSTWQPQLEGAKSGRELPAIVDEIITMNWINFGDGKPPA